MKFAAIFDMDGVLVDTRDLIWNSQNKALERYGIHISKEEANEHFGRPIKEDIEDWNERYGLSLNLIEYNCSLWEEQSKYLRKTGPDKNLVNLLEELERNNVPKGIGTSSERFRAKRILSWIGLRKYFPVLVGQEDVHNHKPSPDVFLEVAKRLATPPEKCVVFEDSDNGVLAAKTANMKVIGYLGEPISIKNYLKYTDLTIKKFSEINYDKLSKMFG
jgi:HAD superfamily hydrolase (TIGR01509 family)